MPNLASNLKRLRKLKDISQDRLSKLADVSANTIAKLETDPEPNPTLVTLQAIAKALGVSVDELIK